MGPEWFILKYFEQLLKKLSMNKQTLCIMIGRTQNLRLLWKKLTTNRLFNAGPYRFTLRKQKSDYLVCNKTFSKYFLMHVKHYNQIVQAEKKKNK